MKFLSDSLNAEVRNISQDKIDINNLFFSNYLK